MPPKIDPIRRVEIVAALSLATDLAIGQPVEFALRSCALSVALAKRAGFDDETIRQSYYQSLLRYIGCNADTDAQAALLGDETLLRREFALIDQGSPREVMGVVLRALRRANADRALPAAAAAVTRGFLASRAESTRILTGHCEVAQRLAARLGFDDAVAHNLGQLYERWDGRGLPNRVRGDAIAPAVRIVTLAQDAIVLVDAAGEAEALVTIRERRGAAYDPLLTDAFLESADELLAASRDTVAWDTVLALEPRPHHYMSEQEFDDACFVLADFVDIRWPERLGHSRAVAALAEAAVSHLRLPDTDVETARRAALAHADSCGLLRGGCFLDRSGVLAQLAGKARRFGLRRRFQDPSAADRRFAHWPRSVDGDLQRCKILERWAAVVLVQTLERLTRCRLRRVFLVHLSLASSQLRPALLMLAVSLYSNVLRDAA